MRALLILGIALRLRLHHLHGPAIDYAGLAIAAAASWIGISGPGEPVLVAAGLFAARHKLDIGGVVLVAWAGAILGGVIGWLAGIKAGRAVAIGPGPLRGLRLRAVSRGEEVFARYALIAIIFTPSWIAGIHGVRAGRFLPINALGAALWACGIGLGAYFVGPAVVDLVGDLGLVAAIVLAGLLVVGVGGAVLRRRRRDRPAAGTGVDS